MDLYFEQGRYQLTANIKCANTTLPSFKAINEKSVADIFCVSPSGVGVVILPLIGPPLFGIRL